jgi:hypothetical protein
MECFNEFVPPSEQRGLCLLLVLSSLHTTLTSLCTTLHVSFNDSTAAESMRWTILVCPVRARLAVRFAFV